MIKELVADAYKELLNNLKSGDEIISGGTYDRPHKTSKKTGEARIKFIETVRQLLISKTITAIEANQATHLFGKKTSDLFWCKTNR